MRTKLGMLAMTVLIATATYATTPAEAMPVTGAATVTPQDTTASIEKAYWCNRYRCYGRRYAYRPYRPYYYGGYYRPYYRPYYYGPRVGVGIGGVGIGIY